MHTGINRGAIAVLLFGIAACSGSGNAYILAAEDGAALLAQCPGAASGVSGYWSPAPVDIAWSEDALDDLNVVNDPHDYIRQYFGVEIDGTQLLYLHAVHSDAAAGDNADFSAPVVVCDGGTSSWAALYDFTRGEFTALSYNAGE